jgi:hypothetical protein
MLEPTQSMRVLDVGAGVGKCCLVGAMSSRATWFGVEQHAACALVAEQLSRELGVSARTRFLHGDVFGLDWEDFDALYLYNPFELSLFSESAGPDNPAEYLAQIADAEDRLARMGVGTRVVTLNGFGGTMPPTYRLLGQEHVNRLGADLVAWIQTSRSDRATELS